MGKSSKDSFQPPADQQAPSGQLNATPGGQAPPWQSILPQGNGPAQLGDPFRSEPAGPPAPPPATAPAPSAGAAPAAAGPAVASALRNLSPDMQREYLMAKAQGNEDLAARILLAATMGPGSPVARNADRSGGMGMGAPSGGGPGWGGGVGGGVGGRSSGGIY